MLGLANSLASASIHEQMYSLSLDGAGDFLNTSSSIEGSNFPVTGTLSLWVTGDFTTQYHTSVVFDQYASDRNNFFIRGYDEGGGSKLQIRASSDAGAGAGYKAGSQITVLDNQWNHVVVTWDTDNATEEFKIYLNGNTTPVSSTSITDDWVPDGQLCDIGRNWLGSIDDVAIWDAVLDADAVATVYNSGKPFDLNYDRGNYDNASDLQAYWRMNDGSGTTVVDSSTNSHNGTLAANATFGTDTPDD